MKKNTNSRFRIVIALILATAMLLLPMDALALGNAQVATPDEAELSATGASLFSGDGSQESPYLIQSSDDWDALSNHINSGGTDYTGKYFLLTDDISVSTVLGNRPDSSTDSNDNCFSGTFDGGGHELNVNLNESGFGAAPFAIAYNATIKNLHVTGTVSSGANHATGLVAASKGRSIYDASYLTIRNVTVSTAISCPSHVAGIVGHAHSADITMENVVFDGSMSASSVQGGMIGWGGLGNGATYSASFKDCLFAGTYNTNAAFYPVAFANGQGTATLINDFYTTSIGSGGSPIAPTGEGQLKLLAATVEKDGSAKYFDNINTAADGSNWTQGSTLRLMADVTTSSSITVPTGEHTLDLNGYGVLMTGSGCVFYVGNGSKLIIDDSDTDTTHQFDVPDGAGLATLNEASGTYAVSGGYITGGSADNGGGIYIAENGEVVMNGGALIGNHAEDNGAGIRMESYASFTLNGGEIAYNQASVHGGGIGGAYSEHTVITVNGGAIHHNLCDCSGGAITLNGDSDSYLYLYGGEIRDNASVSGSGNNPWHPGGIAGNANVHVKGAPQVCNNINLSSSNIGASNHNIEINTSENDLITLDGPLSKGARIAISYHTGGTKTTGVFTSGWSTYMEGADPSKYFVSDYDDYIVSLNSGEAAIALPPVASVTSDGTTVNYTSLSDAVNAWTAGSTLKLMTDVTTGSTVTVPSGEHMLDLNGYGILMTGNDRVVTINQGASLELNDSDPDRIHYITLTNYRGTAVSDSGEASVSNGNGVVQVSGGYLTGGYRNSSGYHDKCGACVFNWGTFVMNGGSIVGNAMQNNSGGAIRNSGYFTMNGGTIAYNYASGGGGGVTTYVPGGSQGKMTMTGGVISDNYTPGVGGGLVLAGPFEMTGGHVVRNTAGSGGSGMYYGGQGDKFKLSGNPVIKDNINDDLYMDTNATFMINGSLTEGADIHILMKNPAEFTVGWKDKMVNADPSLYFTANNTDNIIFLNSNDEAEIIIDPVAIITSGDRKLYYADLPSAISAWTAGSTLKLLSEVTTSSTITVPSGEHTLDLNGYALKAESAGYSVVTVGNGAELTIDDTSDTVGKITGGSVGQNYGGGVTVDGGTLTLKGGAISGNANTYNGIGNCGGGIHVKNDGAFYMEGGEISDNTSYVGGGVGADASDTTVVITGGVIKNNQTERFGSAVFAGRTGSSIFRIGGDAQIVDNISTWTADKDGEASLNFSRLLLSGDPTVHGDWKTSGTSSPNTHINLDNNGSGIQTIELDGELTNDTGTPKLTISPIYRWGDLANGQTFVFTKNWNQYMGTAHPADYFKVDDSVSGVKIIRKDGEAAFTGSGDLGDLYITFDANGGESEMDAQLVTATNATLNKNTFTRDGYAFAGWNTEKDGSGTAYADKASISLSGDLVLYAQWAEPAVSIISGDVTIGYGSLSDAVSAWTAGSTLKLLEDVTTTSTITVPAGAHTLDLNGFTITRTGATGADNSGLVMTVNNGVDLTVTGPGKITGGSGFHGGGIHVEGNSSLVLDNCEISGNTGHYGGGLYLSVGTITLKNGAAVKNNTATEGFGGSGIYAEGGGTLILEDATFTENAIRNGNQHAVFLAGNANIKVSGAPVIYDNTYNGEQKNLYLYQAADQHSYVMPAGALTDGAKIGVGQTTGAGVFTVGWPTYMSDPDSAAYFISSVANYDVLMNQDGELEIAYPLVPDVSAEGFAGDYDGAAHSITVSAPEGASVKYGLQEGSFKLTENPTFTDAGTYTVYYEVSKPNYTAVTGSAEVVIRQINATVTITGYSATVDYDGAAHRSTGYQTAFSTSLYTEHDILFNGTAYAELTDVGTAMMGLKADRFTNTNDNFANVTFNVTDGYITVRPIDVTVTVTGHTLTVDYDGKAHSADGYDAAADSALYDVTKDFTYSGKAAVSRTNAGTTNMGLAAEQFENTNSNFATVTFNVTDGYVKIDPISVTVTITGHNILVDYDGNIHSVDGYDAAASSDLYDVTEDFTFTGRAEALRTNAGKTDMGLKAEQFENTNSNFASVTFNVTDGYIKIDPIDVTVTITGYYFTTDYDGEAHTASGYDVEISDPLYSENDFTFSGTAAVERTNAGTTDMGLKSEQFENINSNFATVVFDVTDGYVRIDPIDVTVTITGHTDTADYDGKAHSAEGYDAVASSDLYDITKDIAFSGTAKAERTDAGTAIMGLNAAQFENTNSNFAKVTFDVTDGYMTIDPINITVTITGHTLTVDYDGKAHSADGYDATADSTLYDVTKNIIYSGRAEAIRTDAGTAQMGLTADKFSNTNDNFAKVTFKVTDGSITIDPVDAEITTAPHAKDQLVYNGSDQTLVEPGTATGGTLCYALGSDERIAPSDSKYNQDVPAAKDAGNYFIWYKVVADSSHNDIAPACVKVTLAEEEWTTVSGRIYDENNNPVSNATVSLTIGGKTVDQIISGSNGSYYFTAPPGLYNIVVKYDGATVTDLIDIDESTTYDVGIFDANTDSLLNIVGTDSNIVVGGLNKEAEAVRASEGVSSDKNVTVSMTVTPIAGGDTYAAAAIEEYASDRNVLYYDFEVEETVDTITTRLDRTQTVLEIAIPCSFINKKELAVYRSDGSDVQTLTESDSKAAGTYRVDTSAGMVFIYTDQITTYALGYKPYYSVTSDLSLGSYTGVVSVTLTNDGGTIYELNDVSMDNISFRGVPKGNYSMTITWTDGAENTITTPFEIK